MNSPKPDPARLPDVDPALLNACDREAIHVPGSIQPHGLLLVADGELRAVAGAGALEERLTPDWLGRGLSDLLGQDVAAFLSHTDVGPGGGAMIGTVEGAAGRFDATLRRSGSHVLAELEPSAEGGLAADVLFRLDSWATAFERTTDLRSLCERAAVAFREMTGFARVMIYRFLDDGAGEVIAEDRDPALGAFLNHHFPASDIPRQARALYVRNRIRVIPDVSYEPQPIRPDGAGLRELDLSDASLRSVSPIHVQYLKNMGVEASASVSIVKDNTLWGLVACHNDRPRRLSAATRIAAQALAGGLARQIKAREDADILRERYRLRTEGEALLGDFDKEAPFGKAGTLADDLCRMFGASGFAHAAGETVHAAGTCPPPDTVRRLARWVAARVAGESFSTFELAREWPAGEAIADIASGLLAVNLGGEENEVFLWFRAEEVQVVNWAGNPHKAVRLDPNAVLTPRSSFEAWSETVRGRARPWTLAEIEAAGRLRRGLLEIRRARQLRELNRRLSAAVAEKDGLLAEKDFLIKEVNHRVQNSLQLVSAFLGVQGRSANNPDVTAQLKEAQGRLSAVALVHRRLYRSDSLGAVDLSRYLEDLCADMKRTMGADWADQFSLDIAPMLVSADRAVTVGLVLTELVINAAKYAYEGRPGPLAITLDGRRSSFRLVVADRGSGKPSSHEGFGTQMMRAMVDRLSGTIEYAENDPGLRVIVMAPLEGQTKEAGDRDKA